MIHAGTGIGRIVTGCLVGGLMVAMALVLGPVAGAQEHVITGTILLTFAAGWALLATLSTRWTDQPQRWAFAPAAFMGLYRRRSSGLRAERRGRRRAWLGLAAAVPSTACWNDRTGPTRSPRPLPCLARFAVLPTLARVGVGRVVNRVLCQSAQ